jgi:hypothetical protein
MGGYSRRAQSDRYPDFRASNLALAFPTVLDGQWMWEFVARYSGATVPDFHGVPCHLIATMQQPERCCYFKERLYLQPGGRACQADSLAHRPPADLRRFRAKGRPP